MSSPSFRKSPKDYRKRDEFQKSWFRGTGFTRRYFSKKESKYRPKKYRTRYSHNRSNSSLLNSNHVRVRRSRSPKVSPRRCKSPKRSRSVSLNRKKKSPIKPLYVSQFVKSYKNLSRERINIETKKLKTSQKKSPIRNLKKKSDDGFQIVRSRRYRKKLHSK